MDRKELRTGTEIQLKLGDEAGSQQDIAGESFLREGVTIASVVDMKWEGFILIERGR